MLDDRKQLGKIGEDVAADYCKKIGYLIVGRHFTSRMGEIDIIAIDEEETVFIEVKTRRDRSFGLPEESVTNTKIGRIINAAEIFMDKHPEVYNYRVDVIVIQFYPLKNHYSLRHIKGIGLLNESNPDIGEDSI